MNYDEEIKWPLIQVEKQKALLLSRRKDLISEMRNEGKSLRSIGDITGLSFARVKQILDAS